MKTITLNLYSFKELSEAAQKRALNDLSDINTDSNHWYQFMLDDYKSIGLEIDSFDVEQGQIKGEFITNAEDFADSAVRHFAAGPMHIICANFLKELKTLTDDNYIGETLAFKNSVLRMVLKDLHEQYEHLTTREAITETIEANDYLFTDDGKLIPAKWYELVQPQTF